MKTITEISPQKRNAKRCNLYLDGEFFSGVQLIVVAQNRLKVGMEISEEKLNDIIFQSEKDSAMQAALSYVSKSLRTRAQVVKYLNGKGYLKTIVGEIIAKLSDYGYLSDEAYSKAYVEQKSHSKGKRLLSYELKLKGVDEKIIEKTLENAPSEDDGAYFLAQKFFKGKEITFENISKCYRRLLSKGFDYDTAKSAVEKIKKENGNFED